jgi:hypothetical protein
MRFKDIPEQAHFSLTEDERIGLDITYIKAYQDGGRYNAVKLGKLTVPVLLQPEFEVTLK